jgi:hypothetical protein
MPLTKGYSQKSIRQEHFQGNEAWETTEASYCDSIEHGTKSQKG